MALVKSVVALVLVSLFLSLLSSCSVKPTTQPILERIRVKHNLPAMAALVIKNGKVVSNEATGTTRIDGTVAVDQNSKWHLGSCTKAITAVIVATVVDEGKISWDTKIIDVFPELKDSIRQEYHSVTLRMLLAHRGGLQHTMSSKRNLMQLRQMQGTLVERRLRYVIDVLQDSSVIKPGTAYSYSNAGYSLAAAMVDRVTKRSYEDLAYERLFKPLGMTSAGFGPQNYAGGESQPMPHYSSEGSQVPIDSGTFADNPDVINPGGRLHMTLSDWGKFAQFAMGKFDNLNILKPETRKALQVPHEGWDYDWGWRISTPNWAEGYLLSHSGSNTMNFATVWFTPANNFAMIIASNAGSASDAINEASTEIYPIFMGEAKPGSR